MRVIICGSREPQRETAGKLAAGLAVSELGAALIINGGASGVDRGASLFAQGEGVPCIVMPAPWTSLGNRAGPVRNAWMITFTGAEAVVAVRGHWKTGPGTTDMAAKARAAGLALWWFDPRYPTQLERDQSQLPPEQGNLFE